MQCHAHLPVSIRINETTETKHKNKLRNNIENHKKIKLKSSILYVRVEEFFDINYMFKSKNYSHLHRIIPTKSFNSVKDGSISDRTKKTSGFSWFLTLTVTWLYSMSVYLEHKVIALCVSLRNHCCVRAGVWFICICVDRSCYTSRFTDYILDAMCRRRATKERERCEEEQRKGDLTCNLFVCGVHLHRVSVC